MDRGQLGGLNRLPSLDAEARLGFCQSLRTLVTAGGVSAKSRVEASEALRKAGVTAGEVDEICRVAEQLPHVQIRNRMLRSVQEMTWDSAFRALDNDRERLESELLESPDDSQLLLDDRFETPDYLKFDFHLQPGGYVGEPLAGELYHHGTQAFYMGMNEGDAIHGGLVACGQEPRTGGVERALDLATGIGQCATALKQRYPDAEVWGLDPSEPLLRYAHRRARRMGLSALGLFLFVLIAPFQKIQGLGIAALLQVVEQLRRGLVTQLSAKFVNPPQMRGNGRALAVVDGRHQRGQRRVQLV